MSVQFEFMKKPKPLKFDDCPFCGKGKIHLKTEHQKFFSKGVLHKGYRWVYKTDCCNKGFTTTESDTISMENLKV